MGLFFYRQYFHISQHKLENAVQYSPVRTERLVGRSPCWVLIRTDSPCAAAHWFAKKVLLEEVNEESNAKQGGSTEKPVAAADAGSVEKVAKEYEVCGNQAEIPGYCQTSLNCLTAPGPHM